MSNLLFKILICFVAGAGAGIGTGFAGMSAVAVIGPMLITFLDMPFYTAVGIGLASDILASAFSAYTYKKNKNIDIKNGLIMMITILLFTVAGSYASKIVTQSISLSNDATGTFSALITIILGLRFIIKPVMATKDSMAEMSKKERLIKSIAGGAAIGTVCGFVGAGGGMMMLLVLTTILGYELKTAVGTSVFIMTFTALTGSASHFIMDDFPDPVTLALCVGFTLLWAIIAAMLANKANPKRLNRVVGIVLVVLGISVVIVNMISMLK